MDPAVVREIKDLEKRGQYDNRDTWSC